MRPPSQDRQAIAYACGAAAPSSRWRGEGRGEGLLRRLRSAEPPAHPDIARRPAKFRTSPRKRWIGERGRRLAFFPSVPQNAIARPTLPFGEPRWGQVAEMAMADFQTARRAMVDGQVRTNEVTNPGVIGAMLEIPR